MGKQLLGLTDIAADEDVFEIGSYIDGLVEFIKECMTPMTISIQGTWGKNNTVSGYDVLIRF